MQNRFYRYRDRVRSSTPLLYRRVVADIRRRPLFNFGVALLILLLILFANSILTRPTTEQKKEAPVKEVSVYSIGTAPMLTLQGKVQKSNVIKIMAQSAGVVSSVNVTEGDTVNKGQTLINLSSNYQGDNAPAVQAEIAQANYNNTLSTYDTQKDIIAKQREVANQTAENTEDLRKISVESRDATQRLIDETQQNLDAVNENITRLSNSTNPDDQAQLASALQLRSQLHASLSQLQSGVNQLNYSTDVNNPPTKLANLQKELTLKGLDIQEKALNLGKEVAGLQASLAWIGASVMTPATPITGRVDRVYVTVGQTVTPGTVLATIVGDEEDPTIIVSIPQDLAHSVSRVEPSRIHLNNTTYDTTPRYVSTEAVEGTQHVILYDLPPLYTQDVTADSYVTVDVPIGLPSTSGTIPFIPIDAVYQSATASYVYVIKNGKAVNKTVTLGSVYGDYTEVTSGLESGDEVIVNRNIVAGDRVEVAK